MKRYLPILSIVSFLLVSPITAGAEQASTTTLTLAQVESIVGLLRSFGAAEELVQNTRVALGGRALVPVSSTDSGSGIECYTFTKWMMIDTLDDDVGGDVSRLQKLLSSLGYYADAVTGAFGAATKTAIERFQAAENIVSSGDIDTTGFGGVGPATREALSNASCSVSSSASTLVSSATTGNGPGAPSVSSTSTSVAVLSPNLDGKRFVQGQPFQISWSGGDNKVQIGLVDNTYDTNGAVLGWISLNEQPNSSLNWDGAKLTDLTGSVSQAASSLSLGPYKIIAVSAGSNGNYCVLKNRGCNYDVSDSYFTLISPASLGTLHVSCTPSVGAASAGAAVTWEAAVSSGDLPYVYRWQGTDIVSTLPTRLDGRFLDVIYNAVGLKTAQATVRDAKGREASAFCNFPITITPAPSPITVLSPNGGESFVLTKTFDPSQFVRVSWQLREEPSARKKDIVLIAIQDTIGRTCVMGSVTRATTEAFIGLVDGYRCPAGNWALVPGQYAVKVFLEGREATAFDTSDSFFTLTAPVPDVQSITPPASAINSQENVTFRFLPPANARKGLLYLSCPSGVIATPPNNCNAYTDVTPYMASSTGYTLAFANSSSLEQKVMANFYVSLPNNPNHKRGVSAQVTIRPAPTAVGASVGNSITILSPNGGEKIYFGVPYAYRFKYSQTGVVDMTLVPYPPIDAGLVCQIASGISASPGEFSLTLKETDACAKGPQKVAAGTYTLRATLRNGGAAISADSSDSFFTLATTSTASQ